VAIFEIGQSQDGVDHRGFAHTIATNQGHAFSGVHMQVQAMQDVCCAVVGVHVFQVQ
jgi:hypothetical protein